MKKRHRGNQLLRTRKDLLLAARALLKRGHRPSMEEVAEEAMVSRATAYRHFPSLEALLVEAPLDGAVPTAEDLFGDDDSDDVVERVDRAEAALHASCYRNEAALRTMIAHSLQRWLEGERGGDVPLRQNRRTPLIEAALAPARKKMKRKDYENLCAGLALVFGPEAMIVFSDVLGMGEGRAREVKRWVVKALVNTAAEFQR